MSLLNFFISDAFAEGAAGPAGQSTQGILGFLPLIVIFAIFYFMLIRPQSKRAKEHRNMVANLGKGDEVVTNGGLLGKIIEMGENFITLELADGVQVKVQRQAVSALMPKGTMKGD
jgi:preprotein translocase subunit YajC